jgi:hypothetical protein
MKLFQKVLVVGGLVSLSLASGAHAGSRVSLVGVGNFSMPTATGLNAAITGLTGKTGYGAGALIECPVSSNVGVEIGAEYYQQKFSFSNSGSGFTDSFNTLEVPVSLNVHLNRAFYLSLGGYVSSVLGNVTSTPDTGAASEGGISSLFQRPINFGALGGLGINLPLSGSVSFRAEGRYQLALSNAWDAATIAANSSASWKYSGVQALAGLTFNLGGGKY